ncbi:VOC family protein [Mucilaginibacter sp. McL0603]|uniref:VOC family protein n=1 Tax=Mucilaginibacter sp. McL0603 TaxID=3415670 RepID=UPI003CE9AB66
MITFTRANHINFCVPPERLEEAKQFYTEVIGLKQIPRPDHIFNSKGYWFDIGDIQLHISTEHALPRSNRHIAFEVKDVAAAREQLEKYGVEIMQEPVVPGWDRFAFFDPFGNRVELIQVVPLT